MASPPLREVLCISTQCGRIINAALVTEFPLVHNPQSSVSSCFARRKNPLALEMKGLSVPRGMLADKQMKLPPSTVSSGLGLVATLSTASIHFTILSQNFALFIKPRGSNGTP